VRSNRSIPLTLKRDAIVSRSWYVSSEFFSLGTLTSSETETAGSFLLKRCGNEKGRRAAPCRRSRPANAIDFPPRPES